jgi:uncharacterized protein YegJ (DUF2314 family)
MKKRYIHNIFMIAKRADKNNDDTRFRFKEDIRKDSMANAFWIIDYVHNSL